MRLAKFSSTLVRLAKFLRTKHIISYLENIILYIILQNYTVADKQEERRMNSLRGEK